MILSLTRILTGFVTFSDDRFLSLIFVMISFDVSKVFFKRESIFSASLYLQISKLVPMENNIVMKFLFPKRWTQELTYHQLVIQENTKRLHLPKKLNTLLNLSVDSIWNRVVVLLEFAPTSDFLQNLLIFQSEIRYLRLFNLKIFWNFSLQKNTHFIFIRRKDNVPIRCFGRLIYQYFLQILKIRNPLVA